MNLLLAFAPFIVVVIVERLAGIAAGLGAGAAVLAFLLIRDLLTPGRGIKLLELGTFFLFGLLTLYALAMNPRWSIAAVRLRVDKARWDSPAFLHVNEVISAAGP